MAEEPKPSKEKVPAKQRLKDAWRRLRGGELTPKRAALSVAVGVAVGVTPLFGFHWMIVLAICVPFRLDGGVGILASNISLPFIAPFILASEIAIGVRLLEGRWPAINPELVHTLNLGTVLGALILGTVIVAIGSALVFGALTYGITTLVARFRPKK